MLFSELLKMENVKAKPSTNTIQYVPSVELQVRENAFNRRMNTFAIVNNGHIDIEIFQNDAFRIYRSEIYQCEVNDCIRSRV